MYSNEHQKKILDEAFATLQGTLALPASVNLPANVSDRIRFGGDRAVDNANAISGEARTHSSRLLGQSLKAQTRAQKFVWLRKAADMLANDAASHAACHKGCSHCCHIPVKISQSEAQDIGKWIGVSPEENPKTQDISASYAQPCTFLQDNVCQIYGHRPVVCRTHLNMDQDNLLCQLIEGASIPVPYLDSRMFTAVTLMVSGEHSPLADIREWFPAGKNR